MSEGSASPGAGRFLTRLVRWLVIAVAAAAVVYLLFTVVFPWVDERLINDPVMGSFPHLG